MFRPTGASEPKCVRVRRRFARTRIAEVGAHLRRELAECGVRVGAGERIAIAVGSRGIRDIAEIARETVAWVRAQGGKPFIVPAMGSHGGATAEGQREVLASLGVTEAAMGAPVISSLDVVELPRAGAPIPVYFARDAWEADGTIVINRAKPHTDYHGPYESGLAKMMVIGLGKHAQALAVHALGAKGLREAIPATARAVLAGGNVRLGIGIAENAYDETMVLRAIPAERIMDEEPALLEAARAAMPGLPVAELDLLALDEMGKDISGVGLDTNVIGRMMIHGEEEGAGPDIALIYVRDLTEGSHGNATGMGLADIIARRLYEKVDYEASYENMYTSTFLYRAKTPLIAETDGEALAYAARGTRKDPAEMRTIRARNTLHLEELIVSGPVWEELRGRGDVEAEGEVGLWGDW